MDTRDGRTRITVEVPPDVKAELDKLPHGTRGTVLNGVYKRLAQEIATYGWDGVLWLSHSRFDFQARKESS